MKICQSCAMPMDETGEMYGTEQDGTKTDAYCTYCYHEGKFTQEMSMEQMIEFCIPFMMQNAEMTEEDARRMMQGALPGLKRWA